MAEQQLEALAVSSNALSLLDKKDARVVLPIVPEGLGERRSEPKRRKPTRHIPGGQIRRWEARLGDSQTFGYNRPAERAVRPREKGPRVVALKW
jgi:hypothetical protein